MRWLVDRYFAPAPAERLAAMRILVGTFALVYLLVQAPLWLGDVGFARRDFHPLGVIRLLDQPLGRGGRIALWATAVGLAPLFALGVWHRVVGPLFAAALLVALGYRNSWAMPFHTENLLVLHAIVLGVTPAADAWRWRGTASSPPGPRYGWPLRLMAVITVTTYVIAGVAKLRLGGLAWADGEGLAEQIAVDNLRKHLSGSSMSPIATLFLGQPWLLRGLATLTLVVELGAPLALVHRRVAAAWAIAAWGFHLGVVALMAIVFPYPLAGLAYAPLFACERPLAWLGRRLRRRQHE